MINLKKLVAAVGFVGLLGGAGASWAGVVFSEGFEGAFPPAGWAIDNANSTAGGATTWFKGDPTVFPAQAGSADSYAAANFNAAGFGGNIRDWFITPTLSVANGEVLSFWARTADLGFNDQLQVRMCIGAACVLPFTTANFSTILVPTFTLSDVWTQTSLQLQVAGLSAGSSARIAFGYICNDTSVNCDYIGLDSVSLVPEPSALLVFALGLTTLGWHLRRRSVQ